VLEGTGKPPREWSIHTAIHRAHNHLVAVVHTHPTFATSLGIGGVPLVPVYQHGAALRGQVPAYDDADLITTPRQAQTMLDSLGGSQLLELRGHGSVVCGRSMEEAFALSVILEENARKQLYAGLAGTVKPLRADEVDRLLAGTINQHLFESFWRYYRLHRKLDFD
jgi:ribulose-5-phosphate 4-epimerase/fuculose-1-phosphate aldolase